MIKHRFIVRGADDFRIFAAIPCETQVLTWKRWVRPFDAKGVAALHSNLADVLEKIVEPYRQIEGAYRALAEMDYSADAGEPVDITTFRGTSRQLAGVAAKVADAYQASADRIRDSQRRALLGEDTSSEITPEFNVARDVHDDVSVLYDDTTFAVRYYRKWIRGHSADHEGPRRTLAVYDLIQDQLNIVSRVVTSAELPQQRAVEEIKAAQHDPLPDTPCPPGTPFAAYTIEFQGSIFSIVEGCAWVAARNLSRRFSKRSEDKAQRPGPDGVYPPTPSELWFKVDTVTLDKLSATRGCHGISVADQDRLVEEIQTALLATDDEKRVVEIVTQMLVERGLNPKAETRIPVSDADPKHANQQREAEKRDEREGRAPKVRTIKFHVTPPRYLREAAERIFASPGRHKKAHWVIGHWRNQACGVGHKEHRQQWIKPHIRGLGEAGAVVARVAASDEEVAGRA